MIGAEKAEARRRAAEVGLYNLNPVDPWLESAWLHPLNLKCDILSSEFGVSKSTCTATPRRRKPRRSANGGAVQVGMQFTHSLNAPAWFQPLNLSSENPIPGLCFQIHLVQLQTK
jgi:hypothetical protein